MYRLYILPVSEVFSEKKLQCYFKKVVISEYAIVILSLSLSLSKTSLSTSFILKCGVQAF